MFSTNLPTQDEIAVRAYSIWEENGCPEGTAESDWHAAERQLLTERSELAQTATG